MDTSMMLPMETQMFWTFRFLFATLIIMVIAKFIDELRRPSFKSMKANATPISRGREIKIQSATKGRYKKREKTMKQTTILAVLFAIFFAVTAQAATGTVQSEKDFVSMRAEDFPKPADPSMIGKACVTANPKQSDDRDGVAYFKITYALDRNSCTDTAHNIHNYWYVRGAIVFEGYENATGKKVLVQDVASLPENKIVRAQQDVAERQQELNKRLDDSQNAFRKGNDVASCRERVRNYNENLRKAITKQAKTANLNCQVDVRKDANSKETIGLGIEMAVDLAYEFKKGQNSEQQGKYEKFSKYLQRFGTGGENQTARSMNEMNDKMDCSIQADLIEVNAPDEISSATCDVDPSFLLNR